MKGEWKTIHVPREIKEDLDKLKHPGQALWGVLKELMEFYKRRE